MGIDASRPHGGYVFGDFRLDARRRLLFAIGAQDPLPVTPKAISALLLFLERPGELLAKDELMAALWPGRVVEENSLTQLISVLRHVLGEEPGENRYLATVPGFGYRFIADVVRESATAEPQATPPEPEASAARFPRRTLLIALAGALGVAVLVYGWFGSRHADEASTSANVSPATISGLPARTVAVLPFDNLGTDEGNDYIVVGLADSVLHRLTNLPNLTVIARTSSFSVRDRPQDARETGRMLKARYLLEGSIQRSGERLRVTAQLIDAGSGGHLWSLQFDRTLEDIFAVEDEIAQAVADALELTLDEPAHPYARFGIEAYFAYLRGQALLATENNEDAERAIGHFRRAIEIAPEFAAAHAALADAIWQVALKTQTGGMGELYRARTERQRDILAAATREVRPLLRRALELDDGLAEAYILRADQKVMRDATGAEADYRKGLAINPSHSKGHLHLGVLLWDLEGRDGEGLAEVDRAILLDPLGPRNYYVKGRFHLFTETGGAYTEAEYNFQQALLRAPDYPPALVYLGVIRWHQGRFAEAVRLGERALAVDPRVEWIRRPLAEIYLDLGEVEAARDVLLDAPTAVPPSHWLAVCLYQRRPEQAAALLRADPLPDGFIDADVPAYVLRDAALATGRLKEGRSEFSSLHPEYPHPSPFVKMALAYLDLAMGDRLEAERRLRELLAPESDPHGVVGHRRVFAKAAALTMLGSNTAAIDLLEDAYEGGFLVRWWYGFEREAALQPLRNDPRFRALAARARAHAEAERARLVQMREDGEVPGRATRHAAGPGAC